MKITIELGLDFKALKRTVSPLDAFAARMERYKESGRINSYYRVRSAWKAFEEFGGKDFSFREVTPDWLRNCEKHWRASGRSFTTINIYMKAMKCEMNELVRTGKMSEGSLPFGRGKYEIPLPSSRKMAMTREQIMAIRNYCGSDVLEKYRDLWLFSYLCNGINFQDMIFLRWRNVVSDEIRFVRSKTKDRLHESRVISATFTREMQAIIERWGNPRSAGPDAYLFKYASGDMTPMEMTSLVRRVTSLCNRNLRKLSDELGIPPFSTYSSRHSYATILNRCGVSISYISETLGHSSLQMTENYLGGSTEEERKYFSKFLLE